MADRMFRLLRADEIECRVNMIRDDSADGKVKKGCSLLLYKDARCDQSILDETVGAMNWQRSHSRDNRNCTVSIWCADRQAWVSKEDTGTESNTESEKGLASDSFKRACVNWGIGRELYTAPFVWVADVNVYTGRNGKPQTKDIFYVSEIEYNEQDRISYLVIAKKGKAVFEYGNRAPKKIDETKAKALEAFIVENKCKVEKVLEQYEVKALTDLTEEQHNSIVARIQKAKK